MIILMSNRDQGLRFGSVQDSVVHRDFPSHHSCDPCASDRKSASPLRSSRYASRLARPYFPPAMRRGTTALNHGGLNHAKHARDISRARARGSAETPVTSVVIPPLESAPSIARTASSRLDAGLTPGVLVAHLRRLSVIPRDLGISDNIANEGT